MRPNERARAKTGGPREFECIDLSDANGFKPAASIKCDTFKRYKRQERVNVLTRSILEALETAREYARNGLEAEAALHYRFAVGLLILSRVRSIARFIASKRSV